MLHRQTHFIRRFRALITAACLIWTMDLCAQSLQSQSNPLIPDLRDNSGLIEDARLRWELAGLEAAFDNGFLSAANTLSENLLKREDLTDETRERLLNDRLQVALLTDNLELAGEVINTMRDASIQPDLLLHAFYLFFSDDREALDLKLVQLGFRDLDQDQAAWLNLLRGLIMDADGRIEDANEAFQLAESMAPNELVSDQFELIRMRERMANGRTDDVTISALRESVRSMQGERGGFEAARLLAEAYFRAGEKDQAIEVLNAQLTRPGLREFNLRSDFLLLLGNIAGASSQRGRLALREVITEPASPIDHKSLALTLLAQSIAGPQDRNEFMNDLQQWLSAPTPHPLADRFLAFRAYILSEMGDFEQAGNSSRQLLEKYPNSEFAANALRMLAYTSWNQTPPRYRTAAGYLNQLRRQFPDSEDSLEAGILVADCYFLNGDYANASDMYGAMLRDATGELASAIFFQQILSEIRSGSIDDAARMLDSIHGDNRITREMIWRAEWNLLDYMRRNQQVDKAYERIQKILRLHNENAAAVTDELAIRFRWLEARLTLEAGPKQNAVAMAEKLLAELKGDRYNFNPDFLSSLRSHLLLLKGEAEIASGQRDRGMVTFNQLRQEFPDSGPTILSYLVESRNESAADSLVSAQQSLIGLVDRFPQSEYAPIALWEAALNAEQRGLNIHLQEAITILERLVSSYPDSELVYYARLKQGDLARRLNDFPTALLLYERLLSQYQDHPERYRAEMSRADCLMALGSEDATRFDQAAVIYERNCLLPGSPLAVRVEAGFKWAHSLRQQGDLARSEAVFWLLYNRFVQDQDLSEAVLHADAGRYWLSRILLELGTLQMEHGEVAAARKVYEKLLQMKLPGTALVRSRLDAIK